MYNDCPRVGREEWKSVGDVMRMRVPASHGTHTLITGIVVKTILTTQAKVTVTKTPSLSTMQYFLCSIVFT